MDEKSLRTVEFDRVLERVAAYTSFSAGRDGVVNLRPTTDLFDAALWQAQTACASRG